MFAKRLVRLMSSMEQGSLEAVALNAGPSLSYFTGLDFHLSERPVVFVFSLGNEPTIILPELEAGKLEQLPYPARIFTYGESPAEWTSVFKEAFVGLAAFSSSAVKIGVEPGQLRFMEYEYLRSALSGAGFTSGAEIIAALRAVKDEAEISSMRQAVAIAEAALEATLPVAKIGVTEKEIAAELFMQLIRYGSASALPFSPIVAAGPNGANPHARPSDRKLSPGDLLVIDWGARYGGYVSDLTRTFAVAEIDKEAYNIHNLVQQANAAGRAAGRPGVRCASVDNAARTVIEKGGYGKYFFHRTGHGLGMECHEEPYIRGDNEQTLEVGMTYTVEPGIYLAGRNGVRIEDDMVVTADGAESLSTICREIRVVE